MKKKILLSFIMMICLFIVTGCGTSKSDVESVQKNEELMRRVIDSGADGMTVNFPDKLTKALK